MAAIREGRQPRMGTLDVFRSMDVCFACYESSWSDRIVPVTYLI